MFEKCHWTELTIHLKSSEIVAPQNSIYNSILTAISIPPAK